MALLARRTPWCLCADKKAAAPKKNKKKAAAAADTAATPAAASSSSAAEVEEEQAGAPCAAADAGDATAGDATAGDVAEGDGKGDDLYDLEVEPMRWDPIVVDDRVVDDNGEYIVSKVKWHTGPLAYTTPDAPNDMQARFGYNIVVVKKHQSWWEHYRKYPRLSYVHMYYHFIFFFGVIWVLSFLQLEIIALTTESFAPGALAGEHLGKGPPQGKHKKISISNQEQLDFLKAMQNSYLDANDTAYKGSKNYQMQAIPRPKEFDVRDYLRN
jgi:hypothetical protein